MSDRLGFAQDVFVVDQVFRKAEAQSLFAGLQDVPAFPFGAAVLGLVASVAVGALAGLIPALVALRVRVIDAIRF